MLRVHACYAEAHRRLDPDRVTGELARELTLMARWLGLDTVAVADRGDLAPALRSAVAA